MEAITRISSTILKCHLHLTSFSLYLHLFLGFCFISEISLPIPASVLHDFNDYCWFVFKKVTISCKVHVLFIIVVCFIFHIILGLAYQVLGKNYWNTSWNIIKHLIYLGSLAIFIIFSSLYVFYYAS